VTAQPDSNSTGSTHPRQHDLALCAASHGRCRTVKDRLGVKGSQVQILSSRRGQRGVSKRSGTDSRSFDDSFDDNVVLAIALVVTVEQDIEFA
jgi:hypothetical protein